VSVGASTTVSARPRKGTRKIEKPPDERIAVIHLKGTVAYADWLDDLHRKTHIPKSSLFRLAIAEWAVRNGHPAPPEM
jgi:hypothetical protein